MEIDMVLIECAECGMPFAIPKDRQDRFKKCHNNFYCPMGHKNYYSGQTEEERLKKVLVETRIERDEANARIEKLSKRRKPKKLIGKGKK